MSGFTLDNTSSGQWCPWSLILFVPPDVFSQRRRGDRLGGWVGTGCGSRGSVASMSTGPPRETRWTVGLHRHLGHAPPSLSPPAAAVRADTDGRGAPVVGSSPASLGDTLDRRLAPPRLAVDSGIHFHVCRLPSADWTCYLFNVTLHCCVSCFLEPWSCRRAPNVRRTVSGADGAFPG